MKKKILIVGSGGHAKSCIEIINQNKNFIIKGIVCENKNKYKPILNIPCVGEDKDLERLRNVFKYCFIGIGQIKKNNKRVDMFNKLKKIGYILPKFISNSAFVSKYSYIGEGSIIMNKCIINHQSKIGSNCIINNGSIIEHDVEIGDNSHVSTGVIINGSTKVENNVFIGSGSILVNDISIKKNKFIKAGKIIKRSF